MKCWSFTRAKPHRNPSPSEACDTRPPTTHRPLTAASAKAPIPPLLRLPPDVRLLIYRFLIPTLDLGAYSNNFTINTFERKELRHDGEPCCPAILRTDRQIYNEAVHEWYSYINFTALWSRFTGPRFRFLGFNALPGEIPPSNFRFVAKLTLKITLHHYETTPKQEQEHRALLEACFPTGESQGNLRKLTIDLFIRSPVYWDVRVDQDLLRRSLDLDFSHFRKLHISEFNYRVRLSDRGQDYAYDESLQDIQVRTLEERKAEVSATAQELLSDLGQLMTGARSQ